VSLAVVHFEAQINIRLLPLQLHTAASQIICKWHIAKWTQMRDVVAPSFVDNANL